MTRPQWYTAIRLIAILFGVTAAGSARAEPILPPLVSGDQLGTGWRFNGLPDQKAPPTRYDSVLLDGQRVLRVQADASYGHLVHDLPPRRAAEGLLSWRWRLDQANPLVNLREKAGDDVALKVCISFDLPLAQVPFVERQVLRLARSRTGQALPAATVCYVWDPTLPAGTVLDNAYSRRLRMIVVRGQGDRTGTGAWVTERQDVDADFRRLFGDELPGGASGNLPAVTAVAVSADADNTGGHSLGHVATLEWTR